MMYSCTTYLYHQKNLRIPEHLSENALLSILRCTKSLLMVADSCNMEPFIKLLTTPITPEMENSWEKLTILPAIESTPAVQYLQSQDFSAILPVHLYSLNELTSHSSHEICSTSLICIELTLLGTQGKHVTPLLPALLSNLVVALRTNSLMTWREKALSTFIFAHSLSLIETPSNKPESRSIGEMVADWMEMANHGPKKEERVLEPKDESESFVDFQTRRVRFELSKHIPPLVAVLLECIASESHLNVTVITEHACFLLVQPAIAFFPESIPLLIDRMVSFLYSSHPLLVNISRLQTREILRTILMNDKLTNEMLIHIVQLIDSLPSFLHQHNAQASLLALSQLRGYCSVLGERYSAVFTIHGDVLTQLRTWYETMKELLHIQSISTVGVDVVDETKSSAFFRVIYEFLDEKCSEELLNWIFESVETMNDDWVSELSLWVMNDCLDDSCEAALLLPMIVKKSQTQLNASQFEVFDSLLGGLKSMSNVSKKNASMILYSTLSVLIQCDAFSHFQPQILFLLFLYRTLTTEPGVILACFHKILSHLHLSSLSQLVYDNYDYLLDSTLLQVRLASSLSLDVLSSLLRVLESLWSLLLKSEFSESLLFPFVRDSVNVCRELLHRYQADALKTLLPLTSCLVQLVNEKPIETHEASETSIEWIVRSYLQEKKKTLLPLAPLSPSFLNPSDQESESKEEEERLKDGSDDEKSSENEDNTMWEEQEKPDERYDLLSSIVKDIRYFLQTDDVSLQINTLNIVLEVCKIADKERKQSYLIPMIPLISSLLQTSHFTLFSSALSATMQIISSNPQSTVMYVKEKVWPALKPKLYSCLDARNGDYSQIRSAELADRIEMLICENLERVYSDSIVFGDICGELLEWINEKSKEGAIPEYCQKLLEKVGRFNFDVVAQMLIELDPNQYAALVKKQRQGCVRYRKIVNAQHSTINSIFVESLIRVISFTVCLTSCHLLFFVCCRSILSPCYPSQFILLSFALETIVIRHVATQVPS